MSRRLSLTTLLAFDSGPRPAEHALALLFLRLLGENLPDSNDAPTAWDHLETISDRQLGTVLDDTCRGCEPVWPALAGFFDGVEFVSCSAGVLRRSIALVERVAASFPSATCLADAYQTTRSLSSAQCQGAFFTPYAVAHLLAQIVEPNPGDWLVDPACGGGVMLIAALDAARERHGVEASTGLTLIGVELDPRTAEIARASLVLAGAHPDQFWIGVGNSLTREIVGFDRSVGKLRPLKFTASLANPPFGRAAARGVFAESEKSLVVPDRVLYREVPVARRSNPFHPRQPA